MKPIQQIIAVDPGASFFVEFVEEERFIVPWHVHDEYEIVCITEGNGRRYVGDHEGAYTPIDIALVGPQTPHVWESSSDCIRSSSLIVQFSASLLPDTFLALPEHASIQNLLAHGHAHSLLFTDGHNDIQTVMEALTGSNDKRRVLCLLELLMTMAEQPYQRLCSPAYKVPSGELGFAVVHAFIEEHYDRHISLNEVASIAHMRPDSFSRAFSRSHGRSFSRHLTHIRLNHAQRSLAHSNKSITDICYDCGFGTLSNFNKQFRAVTGINPSDFRKRFGM